MASGMPSEVTDPALLAQLEGPQEVTDPALITQLEKAPSTTSSPQYSPVAQPDPTSAYPVGSELGAFAQNAAAGVGKQWSDLLLGARQRLGLASPDEIAEKRKYDAPLAATAGGKTGEAIGLAPLAVVPGAGSAVGATAMGGLLGAMQPTMGDESVAANAALGAGSGFLGQKIGSTLANWATGRAAEPFMGWSRATGNRAVAQAVGSNAPQLDQAALQETNKRLGSIFQAVRSPNVSAPVGDATLDALERIPSTLDAPSATAFAQNAQVKSLTSALGSTKTAAQLGDISSKLGNQAAGLMSTKGGDRALGRSLFDLKDHVDDLVGGTIRDPALAQQYAEARPQWRMLATLESRPTLLNSSTGDVNLTALGKYLQRYDKPGYARGGDQSDLYNAARWGQATGMGKGPPKLTIGSDLGFDWLKYWALRNPASRALGGATSRAIAPIAPAVPVAGRAGGYGAIPQLAGLLANPE